MSAAQGDLIWEPSTERAEATNLTRYLRWLAANEFGAFADYQALWEWSVKELDQFWESIWRFHDVNAERPYRTVREGSQMPGTRWFPGAKLNYAEHLFRNSVADNPAVLWRSEESQRSVSWTELRAETGSGTHGASTPARR